MLIESTKEIHEELLVLESFFVPVRSNREGKVNAATFRGKFYTNLSQYGSISGVCEVLVSLHSLQLFLPGRQKDESNVDGITLKTDKILTLPLMHGQDWLYLAPLSVQV